MPTPLRSFLRFLPILLLLGSTTIPATVAAQGLPQTLAPAPSNLSPADTQALHWDWQEKELVYDGLVVNSCSGRGHPRIVYDDAGNAYAVWEDCRYGHSDIRFAYRPTDGDWGASVRINDDAGHDGQSDPDIAVDSAGNAYAVWTDLRATQAAVYFAYRPAGGSWGANERVNDGDATGSHPSIAADNNGGAHVAWLDGHQVDPDSGDWEFEVHYASRSADGIWSADEQVSDDEAAFYGPSLQIDVDTAGAVCVLWDDVRNDDTDIYAACRPAGGSWGANTRVNDDAGTETQYGVSVAADGQGHISASWLDRRSGQDAIYVSTHTAAGGWSANEQANDAGSLVSSSPAIASNTDGKLYVAWVDRRETEPYTHPPYIRVVHRTETGWSAAERIDDSYWRMGWNFDIDIAVSGNGIAQVLWPSGNVYYPSDIYSSLRNTITGAWLSAVQVNDGGRPGQTNPSLAVDPSGNTYAVWEDTRENDDQDIYFAYRPAGGSWGQNIRVSHENAGSWERNPHIAVDAAGNAHAIWVGRCGGYSDEICVALRPAGGEWSATERISTYGGGSPAIAVDASGNAYAIWGSGSLYFSERPAGGSWSTPIVIAEAYSSTGYGHEIADIAVGGDGSVHAAFADIDEEGWAGVFSAFRPPSGSWGAAAKVNDGADELDREDPSIGVDSAGNIQVIWYESGNNGDIRAAFRPAGGTWSASSLISDDIADVFQYDPDLSVDATGNAYAVWDDARRRSNGDVYFAYRPTDGAWGCNMPVQPDPQQDFNYIDNPVVSTSGDGHAYAMWAERYNYNQQESHIYFALATSTPTSTGEIAGKVTDERSGQLLDWAEVTAYRFDGSVWVEAGFSHHRTDYTIAGLAPGVYRIGFSGPGVGYIAEYFDNASSIEDATDITVSAGCTSTANAALTPAPLGAIAGVVTAEDGGAPLPGINVSAYQYSETGGFQWRGSATTDPDGAYTVTDLLPGEYAVEFSDPSGVYQEEFYNNAPHPYVADLVTVNPDTTTENINVALALPGSPPVISILRDGNNITLSWTPDPTVVGYRIAYSKRPYFQPDEYQVSYAGVGLTGAWTHTGAASSLDNWCYLVQAVKIVNGSPQFSAPSNRKCEFTFGLVN